MKLYYFPLSTYSQKVMLAIHERGLDLEHVPVDLRDDADRARYREIYPLGKIPLLVLDDGHLIPESSIIVEYLDTLGDAANRLIPHEPTASRRTRFHDRMFDLYLNDAVATLIFEGWKPPAQRNEEGMETARFRAGVIYDFMEQHLASRTWMMGDAFTLADCAAAPPLAYARQVFPFQGREAIEAYWERLQARESWRAVAAQVAPYLEWMQQRAEQAGKA
jgi:glutathione S-transferase